MLTSAVGLMLLSGVAPGGTYVNDVLLGALLSALGMGFTLVPATIVAMQGVERAQSGVASGLLNTSRLVGGALGLAVLSHDRGRADERRRRRGADRRGGDERLRARVPRRHRVRARRRGDRRVPAPRTADTEVVRLPTPTTEEAEHEALAA